MSKFDIRGYLFDTDKVESDLLILLSVFHASLSNHLKLEPLLKAGKIQGYLLIEEQSIQKTLILTASPDRWLLLLGDSKDCLVALSSLPGGDQL